MWTGPRRPPAKAHGQEGDLGLFATELEAAVAVAKDAAANPVVRPANLVTKAEGYTLALSTRSWGLEDGGE